MKKQKEKKSEEHLARASAQNLPISTKHSIEICRHLRYKNALQAKKILTEVIALKKAVPFQRFKRDIGHKPGMAAGRFPKKAAQQILKLIKSAEANAQFKGLNTSRLKITKLLANRAAIPMAGRRHRTGTKRTSLEIEVMETKEKKKPETRLEKSKLEKKEQKPEQKQRKKREKPKPAPDKTASPTKNEEKKESVKKEALSKEASLEKKKDDASKNKEKIDQTKPVGEQ